MAVNKKQNFIVRYFVPFGLRQIGDIIMLAGAVLIITGLCTVDGVLIAGFACYAAGAAIVIARCCTVLFSKTINHRDPYYKSSIVNVIIMGVLFAFSAFGLVWAIVM